MNYFCFVSFFKNYHRLEKSLLLVCFLCSVCRILCVSVDISLNIHGYFITYPWIFHYVSAVTRVFCFVLAIYWLYVFGFSHIGGWFFVSRRLRRLSQIPFSPSVFFTQKAQEITDFGALLRSRPPSGMCTLGEAGSCERSNAAILRILRSLRETQIICVKYIHRTWFFAFFARFA